MSPEPDASNSPVWVMPSTDTWPLTAAAIYMALERQALARRGRALIALITIQRGQTKGAQT